MPLRAAQWTTGSHMRIYRRLKFGNLIDMSVLDTRQWRSDQACGDGLRNCPAALAPARTTIEVNSDACDDCVRHAPDLIAARFILPAPREIRAAWSRSA